VKQDKLKFNLLGLFIIAILNSVIFSYLLDIMTELIFILFMLMPVAAIFSSRILTYLIIKLSRENIQNIYKKEEDNFNDTFLTYKDNQLELFKDYINTINLYFNLGSRNYASGEIKMYALVIGIMVISTMSVTSFILMVISGYLIYNFYLNKLNNQRITDFPNKLIFIYKISDKGDIEVKEDNLTLLNKDENNIITVIPITNEMRGLHNLTNKLSLKFNLPI